MAYLLAIIVVVAVALFMYVGLVLALKLWNIAKTEE